MSDVRLNQQQRIAWWVTCRHTGCDYESQPTLNADEAEKLRVAHFELHEQQKRESAVAGAVKTLEADPHALDTLLLKSLQRLKRTGRIR